MVYQGKMRTHPEEDPTQTILLLKIWGITWFTSFVATSVVLQQHMSLSLFVITLHYYLAIPIVLLSWLIDV